MVLDRSLKGRSLVIILLILLLAFSLRVFRLGYQDLWWDEGANYVVASSSLGFIMDYASAADIHPPLYAILLHFWIKVAGQSEFSLRFPSLAFGVLIVALLYFAGKRLFGIKAGLFAALVSALSLFYLAYSQEARMYSLVTLLTLVSSLLLFELVRRARVGKVPNHLWLLYLLFAVASLYIDYSAAFVLIFQNLFVFLWLAITKGTRLRFLLRWYACQFGILLLYLPWLLMATRQLTGYGQGRSTAPGVISEVTQLWRAFNLGLALRDNQGTLLLWAVAVILAGGLAIGLVKWAKKDTKGSALPFFYILGYCLIPVLVFLIVLHFRPFFHPRYLLVATPGYYLLLGLAFTGVWERWRVLALSVGPAVLVMWGLLFSQYYFDPEFTKDDTRGTAEFIAREARSNDLVLWEPHNPLGIYYRGEARASEFAVDLQTTSQRLTELCGRCQRVFLATWYQSDNDLWEMLPFLLTKYGTRQGEALFKGYKVVWYQMPPKVELSLGDLRSLHANFGNQIALDGFAYGIREDKPTKEDVENIWVTLHWRSLAKIEDDFAFFVHLYDSRGKLVGQDDHLLWNERRLPTSLWQPGETTLSFANPKWAEDVPSGKYQLEVGIYWPKAPLKRLELVDSGQTRLAIATIEVK